MRKMITIHDVARLAKKQRRKGVTSDAPPPKRKGRVWKKRDLEPVVILNPDDGKRKR